jgi:hypothetical protein
MEDRIDRTINIDEIADVMLNEIEAVIAHQVGDIVSASRNKIVHCHDRMALFQETVTKMRPEKTGSAGDYYTHSYSLSASPE